MLDQWCSIQCHLCKRLQNLADAADARRDRDDRPPHRHRLFPKTTGVRRSVLPVISATEVYAGSSWLAWPPILACLIPLSTPAGSASTPCWSRLDAGPSIGRAPSTLPRRGWLRPAWNASAISE